MADREQLCPETFISSAVYRMLITEDRCEGGVCREKDWSKTDGKGREDEVADGKYHSSLC